MVSIRRPTHRVLALAILAATATFALAPVEARAQECAPSPTCSHVTPDAKGMIGLGLIGAEIGFVVPALVQEAMHTNEWWPYLVFPAVGAIGGVVGGYFVEQETRPDAMDPGGQPEVDVALFAVGMALIVPTLVVTLALTAYDPNDGGQGGTVGDDDDEITTPDFRDETTTEAVQVEESGSDGGEFGSDGEAAPTDSGSGPDDQPSGTDDSSTGTGGGTSSLRQRMGSILAGGPGLLRFDGNRVLVGVPLVRRLATFTADEQRSLQLAPQSDLNVPIVSGTF